MYDQRNNIAMSMMAQAPGMQNPGGFPTPAPPATPPTPAPTGGSPMFGNSASMGVPPTPMQPPMPQAPLGGLGEPSLAPYAGAPWPTPWASGANQGAGMFGMGSR